MGVSVVIPCLNEENYIKDCLDSLIENGCDIPEFEILIVDGGSMDATLDIVEGFQKKQPSIRLIENRKKKTPFALNLGIQHSRFEYILIAGAHAVYPKKYLPTLLAHFSNPGIDVIGGAIATKVKTETPKTRAIQCVLSHRFGVGNSIFRIGAGSLQIVDTVPFGLYKKKVFDVAGLYNEKLIRNHDIELSKRIGSKGFKIWLDPTLQVDYFARETFQALAHNNYGNGYWNVKTLFITRNFSSLSIRHYIPLVFIFSLILPTLFGFFVSPVFICIALASLTSYLVILLLIAAKEMKTYSIKYLLLAFISLHFSYGFGSLVGLFSLVRPWK